MKLSDMYYHKHEESRKAIYNILGIAIPVMASAFLLSFQLSIPTKITSVSGSDVYLIVYDTNGLTNPIIISAIILIPAFVIATLYVIMKKNEYWIQYVTSYTHESYSKLASNGSISENTDWNEIFKDIMNGTMFTEEKDGGCIINALCSIVADPKVIDKIKSSTGYTSIGYQYDGWIDVIKIIMSIAFLIISIMIMVNSVEIINILLPIGIV